MISLDTLHDGRTCRASLIVRQGVDDMGERAQDAHERVPEVIEVGVAEFKFDYLEIGFGEAGLGD